MEATVELCKVSSAKKEKNVVLNGNLHFVMSFDKVRTKICVVQFYLPKIFLSAGILILSLSELLSGFHSPFGDGVERLQPDEKF